MYRVKLAAACAAVLLSVVIGFAQKPPTTRDVLKDVKGSEILEELRLREAASLKVNAESKEWTKTVKSESLSKNTFAKLSAAELAAKLKASKLRDLSSAVLFAELDRRARELKGIFTTDDRQDLFRLETQRAEISASGGTAPFLDGILKNAPTVCCLVRANRLNETASGSLKLATFPYSESQHDTLKLCVTERFFAQPCGAFCSGFLVGPDVVVTAGHCVDDTDDLSAIRFVFGYRMQNANQATTVFPKADVYKGKEIIHRVLNNGTGEDWAIIRLDRKVENVTPVKFRKDAKIENGTQLYVIGFPTGLPCKVSTNAKVNSNTNQFVFTSNLDTYAGNSGSPVFNAETHEVEGILVRGGQDFEFVIEGTTGCYRSVVLADEDGHEACTRSTIFASKVPN